MIDLLSEPWPWYVAGPLIALVLLVLILWGKRFGLSSNFRTICSMAGAGKMSDFFQFDWKKQRWNLIFIVGISFGGVIGSTLLKSDRDIKLHPEIIQELKDAGIKKPGAELMPTEIFGVEEFWSVKSIVFIVVGGFLVGFGTRWAGGCTSGHAISGLSELQLPSLIAVIGFFIGGLIVTHLLMPYLLQL